MRFSVGGWVRNRSVKPPPSLERGMTMNMWRSAGLVDGL